MRYLSVCSGIEAATVAWHPLGWTPVAFSEIEPFPSAVLAHHYPNVPNYGDMTKFEEWPLEPGTVDLLVGGTPCQSFSVAGLRKGISDPRGGLMLTYLKIARRFRPRWIVWENVPGVLSSGGGRDFGSLLGGLEELGYGWAYRVLDAQFVRTQRHPRAVPQRRRRVFVVGCLGDWKRAAQVLFERESVQRDSSPRRAQGEGFAADAQAGARAGCYWDGSDIANTLTRKGCDDRMPDKDRLFAVLTNPGNGRRSDAINVAVAFNWQNGGGYGNANEGLGITVEGTGPIQRCNTPAVACPTLTANNDPSRSPQSSEVTQQVAAVHAASMTVRRLTPRECERLQGFPDDYTSIPWRGKVADQCPDGPRYKALGNSMACNCMAWIGERIAAVDSRHDI